tara:strand:+ start:47 stop:211 length:165 start_codon:yes stop_codon:yes gene_type:complete
MVMEGGKAVVVTGFEEEMEPVVFLGMAAVLLVVPLVVGVASTEVDFDTSSFCID